MIKAFVFRPAHPTVLVILLLLSVFGSACGKKGAPTLKSYEKPPEASNVTAFNRENSIYLQWSFPKDKEVTIKHLVILRAVGNDFIRIVETEPQSRRYVDTAIQPEQQYRYKILAESHRGVFSPDSNIITITPHNAPPPPQGASFTVAPASLELKWQAGESGLLYNVYKSTESGQYTFIPINSTPLSSPSYTDALTLQKTVYYTVRSLTNTTIRNEGLPSAEISVDPAGFVPSPLKAVRFIASDARVFLSWDAPAETWVTGFRIYRKTEGREYSLIAETQIPSFIDSEPLTSERSYRVHATGPFREGPGVEIRGVRLEATEK